MLNVLFPRSKWRLLHVWRAMYWCLSIALILPALAQAQPPPSSKPGPSSKSSTTGRPGPDSTQSSSTAGRSKTDADKPAVAPDAGDADDSSADPINTHKIAANEIFRDPKAEKLLDISRFQHLSVGRVVPHTDVLALNAMAGGENANIDRPLIERVVDAMVSKLTDHASIQALVEPSQRPGASMSPAARAIQEATTALLEPIFLAKTSKNQDFLTAYNRVLLQKLTPLLKNHLIPRIQAMVILGQSGSQDMLATYEAQIKDPNQTVWVKLWALEGIVNMTEGGARLSGQAQVDAAKIVSDFLDKEDDIPWPAQLRALEALSALRQGFEPNRPRQANMATAAMRLLADGQAKPEVRAEAAKALGLMPITSQVPKYNYNLVAHTIGLLAAEVGTEIGTLVPSRPVRAAAPAAAAKAAGRNPAGKGAGRSIAAKAAAAPSTPDKAPVQTNPAKAKYLTALLIGPVYQAFDGVAGLRESGLCHVTADRAPGFTENVFELVKAVAKASVDLIYSGSRQVDDRKKDLAAQVKALQDFLEKNAPADRHLVAGGVEFPLPQAEPAELPAPRQSAEPAPKG